MASHFQSASEKRGTRAILQKFQHRTWYSTKLPIKCEARHAVSKIFLKVIGKLPKCERNVNGRGRLGFQEMNSQAEDEKFSGWSCAKDLENKLFRL